MTTFRKINLSRKFAPCPICGTVCRRHSIGRRRLREIGITGPTVVEVTHSKHYCKRCRRHFSIAIDHLAPLRGRFTSRVRRTAVELVISQSLTLEQAAQRMRRKYHVRVPPTTLHGWVLEALAAED